MNDIIAAREAAEHYCRFIKPVRSERTHRNLAKDVADLIWDDPYELFVKGINTIEEQACFDRVIRPYLEEKDWPEGWRRTYHAGWPDRRVHRQMCWPRFYKMARSMHAEMLGRSDVPEILKERIYEAILEDRSKT